MPGHDKIGSPVIEKNEAQVLSVQDDKANVMDLKTFETYDLEIPKDFKDKVKEGVKVIYWELLQDKVIKEVREE